MKVQNCSIENTNNVALQQKKASKNNSPAFKSLGADGFLNIAGGAMQWIQDKGFLASFLIQDVLGMTAPRVGAAFLRDKEVTGKYNIHEGFEVLGREGLTGPCMMAVAPIAMGIAAKFGRSTTVNSQLIKRLGNSFKELISNPNFDKNLLNNKEELKNAFYRSNVEKMLQDTLGKENTREESIKYIIEQLNNFGKAANDKAIRNGKSKSKYQSECINNIIEHVNNIKYSTSDDLTMLDKLKVGSATDVKAFSAKDAIDALIKYCDDVIVTNKDIANLNETIAEDLKNAAITKRFITNVGTMGATLGVMSILPKIYAKSNIAPGNRTVMELEKQNAKETLVTETTDSENNAENISKNEISFKGKGESLLGKFGRKLSENIKDSWASELEYNGHNFTNTLMAGLSLFGLLAPRGMRAYNRAQVDENGKKDLTELYEILIRDIASSLSVVFAVPMLTRACVTSYENKSGFVLLHKDRNIKGWKTALDLLNPYSKAHVLTNSEIASLYNNIDSQAKLLNFCKYINENNGDLYKILSKSEHASELFNDNTLNLKNLANDSKADRNKKITDFVKELDKKDSKVAEKIKKVMKGTGKAKNNKILSFARGLNSVPGIITTFLIAPYILGWFIPNLTYANTRRIHKNRAKEKEQQQQIKIANA